MSKSFNELVKEKGFHWAYAFWEPTEEEKEAEREVFRELGRRMAMERDRRVLEILTGKEVDLIPRLNLPFDLNQPRPPEVADPENGAMSGNGSGNGCE